jgi:Tfp pilus assembly protein PilN
VHLTGGGGYGFGLSPGQFLGLSALELAESIQRENRRQAYLKQQLEVQQQLGKDQAQIDALSKQLAEVLPHALMPRHCHYYYQWDSFKVMHVLVFIQGASYYSGCEQGHQWT